MSLAIEFDDNAYYRTIEIYDELSERLLAKPDQSMQTFSEQPRPKLALGGRHSGSQGLCLPCFSFAVSHRQLL